MKIKLDEIVKSANSLKELLKVKFPVKISYRLTRIADKVSKELETFYNSEGDLMEKYGKKEEKEGKEFYSFEAEQAKLFTKERKDLLSLEVDIEFEKIRIDELGEIDIEPALLISYIFTE